jgi:thymidylate synthase
MTRRQRRHRLSHNGSYPTFQHAYLHELRHTFEKPEYRNAPRGNDSCERVGVTFRIDDPVQRHITLPARKPNLVFCFAESLWYLAGADQLEFISYYAPSIARYSSDGRTLKGTAYGRRIFDYYKGLDQWDSVLQTLRADPDSKRAVIQIFDPHELGVPGNIDVACTLALQFMLRDGRLCGVGFMRANDGFRGMVSDVFSFTFMLETMARQLGVEVGTYTHCVGSLHVYDADASWAERVLDEAASRQALHTDSPAPFPRMPDGDNWPAIRQVLSWERLLRSNAHRLTGDEIDGLDLPDYWRQVVGLFEIYRRIRHRTGGDPTVLSRLHPTFQLMLRLKWPDLASFPTPELSQR